MTQSNSPDTDLPETTLSDSPDIDLSETTSSEANQPEADPPKTIQNDNPLQNSDAQTSVKSSHKENNKLNNKQSNPGIWVFIKNSVWKDGFGKEEATVREYVLILVTTFVVYTVLHLIWPPRQILNQEASQARANVLGQIDQLDQLINSLASNGVVAPSPSPTINPTPTATSTPPTTPTPKITPTTTSTPLTTPTPTITPAATSTPLTTPTPTITPTPVSTSGTPSISPQGDLPTPQRQTQNVSFNPKTFGYLGAYRHQTSDSFLIADATLISLPLSLTQESLIVQNSNSTSPGVSLSISSNLSDGNLNQQLQSISQWTQILRPYFAERPSKESTIRSYVQELSQKTQDFNAQNEEQKKIKLKEIQQILSMIKSSLQENSLFWTGNGKWFEVVFWSLFGTLFYIIQQITEYLLQEDSEDDDQQTLHEGKPKISKSQAILRRRNPQYYSFVLQSPFITLVVLWTLSAAVFNIGGVSLAFNNFSEEVLVSLAFILGLFNRVTATQLNLIVAAIFKDAWKKTVRPINISPGSEDVNYGDCKQFNVIPDVKVQWSIYSRPPLGVIDSSTGMYIAPPCKDVSYDKDCTLVPLDQLPNSSGISTKNTNCQADIACQTSKVIIKAVRDDDDSISTLALITLISKSKPDELEQADQNPDTQPVLPIITPETDEPEQPDQTPDNSQENLS